MNYTNNKFTRQSLLALLLLVSTSTYAQEVDEGSLKKPTNNTIEELVVFGESQNDVAMSAFRNGDFETAKEGFIKNARCALKRERALDSLVTNQNIGIERANVAQATQTTVSSGGGSGGTGGPNAGAIAQVDAQGANPGTGNGGYEGSSQKRAEEVQEYSCENRGFQLYMLGLSQIQLGDPDQALKNFKRATNLSRVLYDAHYRIGLISILNKDIAESRKQLKNIKAIQKKCKKKCTVHDEIKARVDHLDKSIKAAKT